MTIFNYNNDKNSTFSYYFLKQKYFLKLTVVFG